MRGCFFLLLFSIALGLSAQSQIKGVVKDAETGKIIPYANIYLKNHPIGVTAFRDGGFSLNLDTVYRDSLIVSCIGYKAKTLYLPALVKSDTIMFKLETTREQLQEIQVLPRKLKTLEIGLSKWRASHSRGAVSERPDARYLENAHHIDGFIKNVSVYVSIKGIPTAPFRINILGVDKVSGAPDGALIKKDFIVRAEKGNEWVTIDLSKELISFPPLGFFVVVQALPLDTIQIMAYQKALPDIKPSLVKWYAPAFGHNFEPYEEAAKYNWTYGWMKPEWTTYWRDMYGIKDTTMDFLQSSSASSLMIKAEINYYADQKLKVKDLKTKRSIKKVLDRPKKNELKYSQSSPQDLLNSICTAVEAGDVEYLCSYLLYYDDEEELHDMMAFIKAQKAKSDSGIFSQKERENILHFLSSLESELPGIKPTAEARFIYEINNNGFTHYFKNKDGIWKMNPRSTKLLEQPQDLKIPDRF